MFEKLDQNNARSRKNSRMIKYPKHQMEGLDEISIYWYALR